jgi:cation:H+ antiporter
MDFSLLNWLVLLAANLFILIKAADLFTNSAAKLGRFLRIAPFIIGSTIVAIGTSLPELTSSFFAIFEKSSEFVAGSVIGSNIANILLVLGVAALASPALKTSFELVKIDLPFLIGSALLLVAIAFDGEIVLFEAILALVGMGAYLSYTFTSQKRHIFDFLKRKGEFLRADWLELIISPIFIFLGAKYTVEATLAVSQSLNIGTDIIAASIIALGTSLPELATSVTAARRGNSEIAIGTVLGSNIMNSFAVIGLPGLIGTIAVSQDMLFFGLPMMLAATVFYFFITQDREVTRWEGSILVLLYLAFISKLLGLV